MMSMCMYVYVINLSLHVERRHLVNMAGNVLLEKVSLAVTDVST